MKKLFAICLIFLSNYCFSQQVLYSKSVANIVNSKLTIVGKVKNNIIVWISSTNETKKSKFLIFDDRMQLVKEVTTKLLYSSNYAMVNFMACKDSFQVVYQYAFGKDYTCKRMGFDENAELLHAETIDSFHVDEYSSDLLKFRYQFIPSGDKKSFVLLGLVTGRLDSILKINYIFSSHHLYYVGAKAIKLNANAHVSNFFLIDSNKLAFVTTQSDINNFSLHFSLLRLTDGALNTIQKHLENIKLYNITVSSYLKGFAICASYLNNNHNNIYVWKLNNDLANISDRHIETDTVLQKRDYASSLLEANTLNENDTNLFVFRREIHFLNDNGLLLQPSNELPLYGSYTSVVNTDFYSSTWLPYSLDNNYDLQSDNNAYDVGDFENQFRNLKLNVWEFNNHNQLKFSHTFDVHLDSLITSYISGAQIFTQAIGITILFQQYIKGKQQALAYIKLKPDKTYDYGQYILMQLKYKVVLPKSLRIDDNNIVAPCVNGNRVAFIKISLN